MFALTAILLCLQTTADPADNNPQVELVRPDTYAVRRFEEVTTQYLEQQPESDQEKVIRERALLEITLRQINALEEKARQSDSEALINLIRALRAKEIHHKKRITRFEKEIRSKR